MTLAVPTSVLLPASLCVATAAAVCFLCKNRGERKGSLQEGGKIKKILIYPFKSVPPVEVSSAELQIEGANYKTLKDREFMLVDAEGVFITGRGEPSLSLLHVEYNETENCLEITSNNAQTPMELLKVDLGQNREQPLRTMRLTTWFKAHPYEAAFCADAVSEWFSRYLKKKVTAVRLVSLVGKRDWRAPDRFQDACELNILSERSVDNLNELLRDPERANISYRNFRPTLLVETKHPFEEDFWARTVIGDAETEFHSRCDRCLLTTIDPDTGVKTDKEPLITLRKFRVDRSDEGILKYGFRPLLSCHHSILKPGTIRVGQTIMVERAPRPLL